VTASAIVLMPLLGQTKLRLGQRLGSGPNAGEGTQNLSSAAEAAAALIALVGPSVGVGAIGPIAALVVAAIAATENVKLRRGEQDDCCAPIGFAAPTADDCGTGGDCLLLKPTLRASLIRAL
jgi:hypothetical protein